MTTIRVLLVDDQPLLLSGFSLILSTEPDIDVVGQATDGQAAIEAVARLRPDVVLMDVQMPVLDGIEAIRAVAGGHALLAPEVTRRVISRMVNPGDGLAPSTDPAAAPRHTDATLARLTERERDILGLLARGLSNGEIARELFVSEATVKTHVSNVLAKLGVRDRVQAVIAAFESGLAGHSPPKG
ncbi:MAG: response regulator transcription factor [Ornithinimicrobium sp.]|uniref:response regulator transcription factor n=1 Tax=Ornithinimicrobium sp. TaxID=1977084 RepID=UPI003D9B9242